MTISNDVEGLLTESSELLKEKDPAVLGSEDFGLSLSFVTLMLIPHCEGQPPVAEALLSLAERSIELANAFPDIHVNLLDTALNAAGAVFGDAIMGRVYKSEAEDTSLTGRARKSFDAIEQYLRPGDFEGSEFGCSRHDPSGPAITAKGLVA